MTTKKHVAKTVSDKIKREVKAAADAAEMTESAYLAGCITYIPDYIARQVFLREQRRELARVRRMWYIELLALRDQSVPQTQIEYIDYAGYKPTRRLSMTKPRSLRGGLCLHCPRQKGIIIPRCGHCPLCRWSSTCAGAWELRTPLHCRYFIFTLII